MTRDRDAASALTAGEVPGLGLRETVIVQALARGESKARIARDLGMSRDTLYRLIARVRAVSAKHRTDSE